MRALSLSNAVFVVGLVVVGVMMSGSACLAAPHDPLVDITVALKQKNLNVLEETLLEISSIYSDRYGKWLSRSDIAEIIGVTDAEYALVENWLVGEGATEAQLLSTRDYVRATLPLSKALRLTKGHVAHPGFPDVVEFAFLTSTRGDKSIKGTHGTMKRPALRFSSPAGADDAHSTSTYEGEPVGSPNAQKRAYGVPTSMVGNNSANTQMVWGPGTYGVLSTDLAKFYKDYDIPTTVADVHWTGFANRSKSGDNFDEGTLDATYITGMAPGVRTIVSNTDDNMSTEEGLGFGPALLNFVGNLTVDGDLPNVISMSLGSLSWASCNLLCVEVANMKVSTYAECESYASSQRQVCMYDSELEVTRTSTDFMKLGAMGVSLFAATGDGGSHFSFEQFPKFDKIGAALNTVSCQYNFPTFPAASPWVIGVGGTQWSQGGTPDKPVAWVASGGGFSWVFPRPSWQDNAVLGYLNSTKNLPPASSYNGTNRAYPDVAAMASGVPVVVEGQRTVFGGTSASTPAFAGIISLINDIRLNAGLPALGFLNQRLYQEYAAHPGELFYDMSEGTSACDSSGFCCQSGFPAAVGWDPTTGLGAPIWDGLVKYLASD